MKFYNIKDCCHSYPLIQSLSALNAKWRRATFFQYKVRGQNPFKFGVDKIWSRKQQWVGNRKCHWNSFDFFLDGGSFSYITNRARKFHLQTTQNFEQDQFGSCATAFLHRVNLLRNFVSTAFALAIISLTRKNVINLI